MYKVFKDDGVRRILVATFATLLEREAFCRVRSWHMIDSAGKVWALTT